MNEILRLEKVTRSFGKHEVLRGIDLSIAQGDFVVLFGRHGSGKSTLMRAIMGLEHVDEAGDPLRGASVAGVGPGERNIGYVPQSFALFPEKTVYVNIAYPLSFSAEDKESGGKRVRMLARMLHIDHLLEKYPTQLSGGEKQRVAIARGLVKKTDVYVLDDPLAGLDFKLREQLVDDIRDLHKSINATILYATSDPLEALSLANSLAVIEEGTIVDYGPPAAVYRNPRNVTTMMTLGFPEANILPGKLEHDQEGNTWNADAGLFKVGLGMKPDANRRIEDIVLGIRPESIHLAHGTMEPVGTEGRIQLRGRIALIEDLGGEMIVHMEVDSKTIRLLLRHDEPYTGTNTVAIAVVEAESVAVFDEKSGSFIARGKGLSDG